MFEAVASTIERSARLALDANFAQFYADPSTDSYILRLRFDDLVPPLRLWHIAINGTALVHEGSALLHSRIADAHWRLEAERMAMHWAAVDL